MTDIDWSEWSREAVRLMQQRNDDYVRRFALAGRPYQWDLHKAAIVFPSFSMPRVCGWRRGMT